MSRRVCAAIDAQRMLSTNLTAVGASEPQRLDFPRKSFAQCEQLEMPSNRCRIEASAVLPPV